MPIFVGPSDIASANINFARAEQMSLRFVQKIMACREPIARLSADERRDRP